MDCTLNVKTVKYDLIRDERDKSGYQDKVEREGLRGISGGYGIRDGRVFQFEG